MKSSSAEVPPIADDEVHLRKWIVRLLKSWVLLLAGLIAGALAGWWVASTRPPLYEASVLLRVDEGSITLSGLRALLINVPVASQLAGELGLPPSNELGSEELLVGTTVEAVANTPFVHLKVRLADPRLATRAVTRMSEMAVQQSTTLWRQISADRRAQLEAETERARQELTNVAEQNARAHPGTTEERIRLETELEVRRKVYVFVASRLATARIEHDMSTGPLKLVNTAAVPDRPLPMNRRRTVGLGLLAGLVLAACIVVVREWRGSPPRA